MFGIDGIVLQVQLAELERKEEQQFEEFLATLSPADAQQLRTERKEAKEKARQEAIAERRHRELCDAIRSTRPYFTSRYR